MVLSKSVDRALCITKGVCGLAWPGTGSIKSAVSSYFGDLADAISNVYLPRGNADGSKTSSSARPTGLYAYNGGLWVNTWESTIQTVLATAGLNPNDYGTGISQMCWTGTERSDYAGAEAYRSEGWYDNWQYAICVIAPTFILDLTKVKTIDNTIVTKGSSGVDVIPYSKTFWLDATNGDDSNDGLTASTAKKTLDGLVALNTAANHARNWTINIKAGTYTTAQSFAAFYLNCDEHLTITYSGQVNLSFTGTYFYIYVGALSILHFLNHGSSVTVSGTHGHREMYGPGNINWQFDGHSEWNGNMMWYGGSGGTVNIGLGGGVNNIYGTIDARDGFLTINRTDGSTVGASVTNITASQELCLGVIGNRVNVGTWGSSYKNLLQGGVFH